MRIQLAVWDGEERRDSQFDNELVCWNSRYHRKLSSAGCYEGPWGITSEKIWPRSWMNSLPTMELQTISVLVWAMAKWLEWGFSGISDCVGKDRDGWIRTQDSCGRFWFCAFHRAPTATQNGVVCSIMTFMLRIGTTPFEMLYGEKRVSKFRPWGCRVYMHLNKNGRREGMQ